MRWFYPRLTLRPMLLFNDNLLPTVALPLPNRGLAFGDGFFETLIFIEGRVRLAADCGARMQQAPAALHLALPAALATTEGLETAGMMATGLDLL